MRTGDEITLDVPARRLMLRSGRELRRRLAGFVPASPHYTEGTASYSSITSHKPTRAAISTSSPAVVAEE